MRSHALSSAIPCAIMALTVGCSARQCPEAAATSNQAPSHGVQPVSSDPDLQSFLERHKEALNRMLNGDDGLWNELASHSDEATLFPPFGGVSRGWNEIGARYTAAAARRPAGQAGADIELYASGVSGDLAYLVGFERARFHVRGSDELRPGFTRVTHILRREDGQWRLLHRHMDHLPESFVPPDP